MEFKILSSILLLFLSDVASGRTFSIIGPQTTQPGTVYRAYLTSAGESSFDENQLIVSLVTEKNQVVQTQYYNLDESDDHQIELNIPIDNNAENYVLRAGFLNEKPFEQLIKVIAKKFSIFVQTDKAFYRAGDDVQFRVLALDAAMKPYQYQKLSVEFIDGENERFLAVKDAEYDERGFYEGSFKLANELNVGNWEIQVTVDNERNDAKQNFEVVDYDLPEFEAFVEPTKKNVLANEKVLVEVYAKRTIGSGINYVKGKAVVTASAFDTDDRLVNETSKETEINKDKVEISFNVRDILSQNNLKTFSIKFFVTFEDIFTRKKVSAESSSNVTVHRDRRQSIEIKMDKEFFVPGTKHTIRAVLKNYDGSIANINNREIELNYQLTFHQDSNSTISQNIAQRPKLIKDKKEVRFQNGIAELQIDIPQTAKTFVVGYMDWLNGNTWKVHKVFRAPENLELKVNSESFKNGEVSVRVVASHIVSDVYVVVIGRSGMIYNQKYQTGDRKQFNVKFKILLEMLPVSNLIVFYNKPDSEVIYSQAKLQFNQRLLNQLQIKFASEKVDPNTQVLINFKAAPNSFVGFLAVESKVSPSGAKNNIDESKVFPEIDSYIFSNVFNDIDRVKNPHSVLSESNAFLITNGETPGYRNKRSADKIVEAKVPETWIFESFKVDNRGIFTLNRKLPDKFTTYTLTAFSMSPQYGLQIAQPKRLTASKDFFAQINLPHSVYIGEILKVEVLVYNFRKTPKNDLTEVILFNDKAEFEILESRKSVNGACEFVPIENYSQKISLNSSNTTAFYFFIQPLTTGNMKISVKAKLANVEIETTKYLEVKYKGLEQSASKFKFLDLRSRRYDSHYFPTLSDDAIESSIHAETSVIGNLMGPKLENIENLLDIPTASTSQQILSKYFPTAVALNYLRTSQKLTPDLKTKGQETLTAGYQYVLSKKLKGSGAFSEWNDSKPDLFLTSLVLKFLSMIKEWVEIDDRHITETLNYLRTKQNKGTGHFAAETLTQAAEKSTDQTLTANIAISLLENVQYVERYKSVIDKSLKYVNDQFDVVDDSYGLAISAYALALGKHDGAGKFLGKLMEKAQNKTDGTSWLTDKTSDGIKIAAYAVLTFVRLEKSTEARDIIKWLVAQRNNQGGFSSAEDTIIGIQAITEAAKHLQSGNFNMDVYFIYDEPSKFINVHIDNENAEVVRKVLVPSTDGVSVNGNGTGVAYVKVWWNYYKNELENENNDFKVQLSNRKTDFETLILEVCVSFEGRGSSGVTVAEINLPSGYEYDEISSYDLKRIEVKKIQLKNNRNFVILFFEEIKRSNLCLNIKARRSIYVDSIVPVPVKVYKYDDKDRYSLEYYLPASDAYKC